jgi:arabinofuranosyltransferase
MRYDRRVNVTNPAEWRSVGVGGPMLTPRPASRPASAPGRREGFLVVVGTFAAFTYLFLANSWVGDDAYIMFRVVDNLVNGYGLRWNPAERVQAFTAPLWVFVLSPFYAVTREIFYTSLAVSLALCIAALVVARRAFPRIDQWAVLALLLFSSKAFIDYTSSGLEYPLLYLLMAVLYVGLFRQDAAINPPSSRTTFGLALLAALAFVCRIDAILLFVPTMLWLAWVRWNAYGLRGLLPVALGSLPAFMWLTFAVIYYGFAFPNTYYAKASAGFPASVQLSQGLAYLLNSLRFDPITLVTVGMAVGSAVGGGRRHRLIAAGALLTVLYVVWIGGDFMGGRFFAPAFLLCAMTVVALVETRTAVVACLGLLLSYNVLWPIVPSKTTASYDMAWPWRTQNGIKDERGGYHRATNVLFFAAFSPRPNDYWSREAVSLQMSPERVFVRPSIGRAGFMVGPEKYIIDNNGLSDPLLAHVPIDESVYFEFYMGHFFRPIPDGYVESRKAGRNLIEDPLIRDYYDRLLRITAGPIWSAARFRDIFAVNLGQYRQIHRLIGERHQISLSVRANNPRFSSDVGIVDDVRGIIRSTGRAGLLQFGPAIPLRAGRYEAEWTGAVEAPAAGPIGFVVACYADCTRQLGMAEVHVESYKPDTRTIAKIPFLLRQPVRDIEYRLFITEQANVTLERVALRGGPVGPSNRLTGTVPSAQE